MGQGFIPPGLPRNMLKSVLLNVHVLSGLRAIAHFIVIPQSIAVLRLGIGAKINLNKELFLRGGLKDETYKRENKRIMGLIGVVLFLIRLSLFNLCCCASEDKLSGLFDGCHGDPCDGDGIDGLFYL